MKEVAAARGWLTGQRVLDYGCGSGVLGLAALRYGAANLVSADLDRYSLQACRANAEANGVAEKVQVRLPPPDCLDPNMLDFFGDFEDKWHAAARAARKAAGDIPAFGTVQDDTAFGCVIANMRKNALVRNARRLVDACRRGGVVVLSGFMIDFEERAIVQTFRDAGLEIQVDFNAPSLAQSGDIRACQGYGCIWGRKV
eukprot:TRINITY_DN37811_c0_g1_i1.p1 TRINITY_DN37811_c0_g1~~TRINITY_DN37811_c0_g1_i1.p1  ORF type:complete len:199 (+),score=47.08 TRINITY_DN37811_c0_g1_i1:496-1092(+)